MAYGIQLLRLVVMRHGRKRGRGRKEKRASPCDPESESLPGVISCCATKHRRPYDMTPDLRWHGQQLPLSSLYTSTEYSTSVDGILPHTTISWRLYLVHYTYHVLIAVVSTHGTTKSHSLVHTRTSHVKRPWFNK